MKGHIDLPQVLVHVVLSIWWFSANPKNHLSKRGQQHIREVLPPPEGTFHPILAIPFCVHIGPFIKLINSPSRNLLECMRTYTYTRPTIGQIMLSSLTVSQPGSDLAKHTQLHTYTYTYTHNTPKPTSMIESTFCPHEKIRVLTKELSPLLLSQETGICLPSCILKS